MARTKQTKHDDEDLVPYKVPHNILRIGSDADHDDYVPDHDHVIWVHPEHREMVELAGAKPMSHDEKAEIGRKGSEHHEDEVAPSATAAKGSSF